MHDFSDALIPAPRLIVVLSGAVSGPEASASALERASMPWLGALARVGRVGRLRLLPPHLPASRTNALAALAGFVASSPLDQASVAARVADIALQPGEHCSLVRVREAGGRAAPALEVHRVAEVLGLRLPSHRVVGQRRRHELLLAGPDAPQLPPLDGVELQLLDRGAVPAAVLDARTVVVARHRSSVLGVGSMLGAAAAGVPDDGSPANLEAGLRLAATAALLRRSETVVVDVPSALRVRRQAPPTTGRQRELRQVLERLDRSVIGPLWAAAAWCGATMVVTSDLPLGAGDEPLRGDVPIVVGAPRSVALPEPAPDIAVPGRSVPPRYSEAAIAGLPIVTSPLRLVPEPRRSGPRRFVRDPVTGTTHPERRLPDGRRR